MSALVVSVAIKDAMTLLALIYALCQSIVTIRLILISTRTDAVKFRN